MTNRKVSCSKCKWTGLDNDFLLGEALWGDMGSGVILNPAGACPKCEALVYYDCEQTAWMAARAAPDMLAALEAYVADQMASLPTVFFTPEDQVRLDKARAAIAKAKGV